MKCVPVLLMCARGCALAHLQHCKGLSRVHLCSSQYVAVQHLGPWQLCYCCVKHSQRQADTCLLPRRVHWTCYTHAGVAAVTGTQPRLKAALQTLAWCEQSVRSSPCCTCGARWCHLRCQRARCRRSCRCSTSCSLTRTVHTTTAPCCQRQLPRSCGGSSAGMGLHTTPALHRRTDVRQGR